MLIAEPNAEVRRLFETVVRALGWSSATYAPDADATAVDVVVLEPSFLEAVERLEAMPARERPPVVLVSIYPQDERTRALDAVAFLQKPFAVGELQCALREATAEPAAIQTT